MAKSNEPLWYSIAQPLLGKVPDAHIAEKVGVSTALVQRRRSSLGIKPIKKQGSNKWSATRPEWHAVIIPMLGHIADNQLSRDFGIEHNKIQKLRVSLKIPPAGFAKPPQPKPAAPANLQPLPWHPQALALFGTMSDFAIAEKLNISRRSVLHYRQALQIAPFKIGRASASEYTENKINTRLIALQNEYAAAADIRNQHPQRYTPAYQAYLCKLRDKLAESLNLTPQQVQDGYATLRARLNLPVVQPESPPNDA